MKKGWIVLIVVLVIAFFVGLVLWQKKQDARPFNHYDFPETIQVMNATEHRADTICMLLANEILGMDTLNMTIAYIPVIKTEEIEFYAVIQYLPFKPHQFVLLLKKDMSFSKLKETLSHEFVHVGQYIYGDLTLYPNYAVYTGDTIVFSEVDYKDRSFEKDAFKQQRLMEKNLEKLLWN